MSMCDFPLVLSVRHGTETVEYENVLILRFIQANCSVFGNEDCTQASAEDDYSNIWQERCMCGRAPHPFLSPPSVCLAPQITRPQKLFRASVRPRDALTVVDLSYNM